MRRKITFWMFAALLGIAGVVCAQQVTMEIQPPVLRLTEAATLTLRFENVDNPPAPELADVPGFQVQYVGREQQMSIINGRAEQAVNFRYRLTPVSTGAFTIGPFELNLAGRSFTLDPVKVEVLPASGAPGQSGQGQQLNELLFAKIRTDRVDPFAHQEFELTIDLYYRGIQLDRSISLNDLPASGLELDSFEEIRSTREAVGAEVYDVRHFRTRAKALSAGEFNLAPTLRVNVIVEDPRRRQDPFGGSPFDMFFQRHETRAVAVPVEPWTLTVRAIPEEGRPSTFAGAVGVFDMQVTLSRKEVNAGEPVTLTVRINGRGNLDTIAMPALALDEQKFRVYDPKLVEQTLRDSRSGGAKAFEQVIIPRSEAVDSIPPVSFSYFDPEQGGYRTITRGPFALTVNPSDQEAGTVVQLDDSVSPAVRKALGEDIVFVKNPPDSWRRIERPGRAPGLPWPVQALPALAVAAAFGWRRRTDALRRDPGMARRLHAPRAAKAALADAEQRLDDPALFYADLWRALVLYFANRLNRDQGQITPDAVRRMTEDAGCSTELRASLDEILTSGEALRFGAGSPNARADRERHLRDVAALLRACEKGRVTG